MKMINPGDVISYMDMRNGTISQRDRLKTVQSARYQINLSLR